MNALSVSDLINVTINLAPPAASFPNFNSCLILGTSTVIDVTERIRRYTSLTQVSADFGISAQEYFAAVEWFAQRPAPTSLYIGRWANVASHGQLIGGGLAAANLLPATWAAISNGSVKFTIDAGGEQSLTAIDFTGQTTLNGVATVLDTALAGATVAYDSINHRFIITSATTGATSTVSFATAGAGGTDISIMLAMRSTSSGCYQAAGIAAESALACVVLFDNRFGSLWYGLVIPSGVDNDSVAVAGFIEASRTLHFFGVNSQEAGVLSAVDTTNIAYLLKQLGYNKSTVQYSSTSLYAIVSLLARILTTNWQGNNTTITLMYKQEPGIIAETLTETQAAAVDGFNCNVFVGYNNNTAIIQNGKCASGQFIDTVIGVDWLSAEIQTNLFNLMFTSSTKIPQTDGGNHQLATQIAAGCAQGVTNGLLAPGTWNAGGFGQLKQGDFLDKGYYIYQPPISSQPQADREARKSVPFQVAVKLGGAVHTVDVQINVNA